MREEIENALTVLKRGGVILYPTDTVWGIGCDATNAEAIDKVYKIKKRAE
ncbi:MAG: translation factor Sua5, partial [Flavobacteriaceae bacterium]|nr:translation factor Sua5 [Flavobacteriaceae bacterium]